MTIPEAIKEARENLQDQLGGIWVAIGYWHEIGKGITDVVGELEEWENTLWFDTYDNFGAMILLCLEKEAALHMSCLLDVPDGVSDYDSFESSNLKDFDQNHNALLYFAKIVHTEMPEVQGNIKTALEPIWDIRKQEIIVTLKKIKERSSIPSTLDMAHNRKAVNPLNPHLGLLEWAQLTLGILRSYDQIVSSYDEYFSGSIANILDIIESFRNSAQVVFPLIEAYTPLWGEIEGYSKVVRHKSESKFDRNELWEIATLDQLAEIERAGADLATITRSELETRLSSVLDSNDS